MENTTGYVNPVKYAMLFLNIVLFEYKCIFICVFTSQKKLCINQTSKTLTVQNKTSESNIRPEESHNSQ